MAYQIRKNVFETNSSSSHSLTMGSGVLAPMPFTPRELKEGVVKLCVGEYHWEWHRYYKARNKLNYLLTQVTDGCVPGDNAQQATAQLLQNNPHVAMLAAAVKAHTGCDILVSPGEGGIDHQSARPEGDTGMELFQDEGRLKSFIFDETAYLQTGNDNQPLPWAIDTDRGSELTHAQSIREAPSNFVRVELEEWRGRHTDPGLMTSQGALLCSHLNSKLYRQLKEEGVLQSAKALVKAPFSTTGDQDRKAEAAALFGRTTGSCQRVELWLAPTFQVEAYFERSEQWDIAYTLSVAVPQELSAALKRLPKTAPTLVSLFEARECLLWLATAPSLAEGFQGSLERADLFLQTIREAASKVQRLEVQAQEEGLL